MPVNFLGKIFHLFSNAIFFHNTKNSEVRFSVVSGVEKLEITSEWFNAQVAHSFSSDNSWNIKYAQECHEIILQPSEENLPTGRIIRENVEFEIWHIYVVWRRFPHSKNITIKFDRRKIVSRSRKFMHLNQSQKTNDKPLQIVFSPFPFNITEYIGNKSRANFKNCLVYKNDGSLSLMLIKFPIKEAFTFESLFSNKRYPSSLKVPSFFYSPSSQKKRLF